MSYEKESALWRKFEATEGMVKPYSYRFMDLLNVF